jgi:hypothetical protein
MFAREPQHRAPPPNEKGMAPLSSESRRCKELETHIQSQVSVRADRSVCSSLFFFLNLSTTASFASPNNADLTYHSTSARIGAVHWRVRQRRRGTARADEQGDGRGALPGTFVWSPSLLVCLFSFCLRATDLTFNQYCIAMRGRDCGALPFCVRSQISTVRIGVVSDQQRAYINTTLSRSNRTRISLLG